MDRDSFYYGKFPKDFNWGLATSSFQIEGGWNADGKGESIWDDFCHKMPSPIKDKSTGDIACDSYNKFQEDISMLELIGAKFYRFSVSWPRILPNGSLSNINQQGLKYYHKLIDGLLAKGIEPMLTLFHWDLPQQLEESFGGWMSEKIIPIFTDFARLCFTEFGGKVKYFVTLNEPWVFTSLSYEMGLFAPGKLSPGIGSYQVVHNMLKAHAEAFWVYKTEFKTEQKGKIGISFDTRWFEPENSNLPEDREASEIALQFRVGWIVKPLVYGNYPKILCERAGERLPKFEPEWQEKLRNSFDYLGVNHYSSDIVNGKEWKRRLDGISWENDLSVNRFPDEKWPIPGSPAFRSVPWGFRKMLKWIKDEYGNPEVFVTENGTPDFTGVLEDKHRVEFYKNYINEMLKAIKLDGCNITGYLAWSLLDNFEWASGYTEKFGVIQMGPNLERIPKDSAKYLKKLFANNGFLEK